MTETYSTDGSSEGPWRKDVSGVIHDDGIDGSQQDSHLEPGQRRGSANWLNLHTFLLTHNRATRPRVISIVSFGYIPDLDRYRI